LRILPLSGAALQVLASLPEGAAGDLVFAGVDLAQVSVYTKRVFHRLGHHGCQLSHLAPHQDLKLRTQIQSGELGSGRLILLGVVGLMPFV
jgi:hypothetical protein